MTERDHRVPVQDAQLVMKALKRAAKQAGLPQSEVVGIIRSGEVGELSIDELSRREQWESALLFLRCQRQLHGLTGGDLDHVRHWMRTKNAHLDDQIPKHLMRSRSGLDQCAIYLDALSRNDNPELLRGVSRGGHA